MHQAEPDRVTTGCDPSDELFIPARLIRPGDHVPPQRALHGTRHQDVGFTVGPEARDVVAGVAGLAGRMLLYGPAGKLDSLDLDSEVAVRRPACPAGCAGLQQAG